MFVTITAQFDPSNLPQITLGEITSAHAEALVREHDPAKGYLHYEITPAQPAIPTPLDSIPTGRDVNVVAIVALSDSDDPNVLLGGDFHGYKTDGSASGITCESIAAHLIRNSNNQGYVQFVVTAPTGLDGRIPAFA